MANKDNNRRNEAPDRRAGDTSTQNAGSSRNQGNRNNPDTDGTDEAAHRGSAQADDFAGDAQNVNADNSRPLQGDELKHARNKANESKGTEDSR